MSKSSDQTSKKKTKPPNQRLCFVSKQMLLWNDSVYYLRHHSRRVGVELSGKDCPSRLAAGDDIKDKEIHSNVGLTGTPVAKDVYNIRPVATDAGVFDKLAGRWDNSQIMAFWEKE